MKISKISFFLLTLLLSGCAIVPVNRFHTGKTLDPGKVKLGSALYEAKDVSSSFLNTQAPSQREDVFPALELFGRVGILKGWDAALRLASPIPVPLWPTTIVLDNRIQLYKGDPLYPDISGGISLGYSHSSVTTTFNPLVGHEDRRYHLYFSDFPLAISHAFSSSFTLYGGGMFSLYSFSGKQINSSTTEKNHGSTYSFGTFLGSSVSFWKMELMPEIALSTVRKERDPKKGATKVFFFPGMALAFNF